MADSIVLAGAMSNQPGKPLSGAAKAVVTKLGLHRMMMPLRGRHHNRSSFDFISERAEDGSERVFQSLAALDADRSVAAARPDMEAVAGGGAASPSDAAAAVAGSDPPSCRSAVCGASAFVAVGGHALLHAMHRYVAFKLAPNPTFEIQCCRLDALPAPEAELDVWLDEVQCCATAAMAGRRGATFTFPAVIRVTIAPSRPSMLKAAFLRSLFALTHNSTLCTFKMGAEPIDEAEPPPTAFTDALLCPPAATRKPVAVLGRACDAGGCVGSEPRPVAPSPSPEAPPSRFPQLSVWKRIA